jgi:hypothetical protein
MGWHAIFFILWGFHAQMLMLQEISCLNNAAVSELILGLRGSDIAPMSLGLSHSLSCYKLKFSPDKVIL